MKVSSKHKRNRKELQPLDVYIKETEKNRQKEYDRFLERVSDRLSIPKDVIAGQAMISMTGNHVVRVCNYRVLEEYSTEEIRLSLGKKSLLICGSHLLIEVLRKGEIKIVGTISNISFVQ